MPKFDLVIFDFDGTLVDTADDIAFHANEVLERYSFGKHPIEEVKKAIGRGVHELMMTLEPSLRQDSVKLEQCVRVFKETYICRPVIASTVYPHVKEMLDGPFKDRKKAIITNKPHQLTLAILRLLELEDYFDVIIGTGIEYPPKPDPTAVLSTMEELKVAPQKTVLIGDSRVDWQTAKNSGVTFAHVTYGYDSEPIREGYTFQNAKQWESLLK